jgi:ketosteroid isomerase-like protein
MLPRRPLALLCALVLPAMLAAGCGKSDQDKVRDTLAQFEQATKDRDFKELCNDVLSKKLVQRLETIGLTCEQVLDRSTANRVLQPSITVEEVKVRGDVALARVQTTAVGEKASTDTIRLVKEGDNWRVSSLSGAQPPAPQPDQAGN